MTGFLSTFPIELIVIIMFVLLIGFYVTGHRMHIRTIRKNAGEDEQLGSISGTLLGLLALLLAFTFGMSNSRYDTRRQIIIDEANAIATVVQLTKVYPDSAQRILKGELKNYVKSRMDYFETSTEVRELQEAHKKSREISQRIWVLAAKYAQQNSNPELASQLLPALNNMMEIAASRLAASEATVPDSILIFLFILSFVSAFLLGYERKNHIDWIVVAGFSLMLSLTIFIILDLDRSRGGFITTKQANQKIIQLQDMFEAE